MPVQHGRDQAVGRRWQGWAAFEPRVDLPLHRPHVGHGHLRRPPPQRVGRRQICVQPAGPEPLRPGLDPGVQAAQPGQEQDGQRPHDHGRAELRLPAGVGDRVEPRFPAEARPGLGQESSEEALVLALAQLLEIQATDLFQEPPGVVVVRDPLPHPRFPGLGHAELAELAALRKHQLRAGVQFPAGALAGGLAADPPALEQIAAQPAAWGDQAGQGGTGLAFRHAHVGPGAGSPC